MNLILKGWVPENPFGFNDPSEEKSRKMAGNMWAVVALAAAVAGLIIFLIRHKQEDLVGEGCRRYHAERGLLDRGCGIAADHRMVGRHLPGDE